jgi:hypothetical protein
VTVTEVPVKLVAVPDPAAPTVNAAVPPAVTATVVFSAYSPPPPPPPPRVLATPATPLPPGPQACTSTVNTPAGTLHGLLDPVVSVTVGIS